jgi:hypothetical protein
VPDVGISVLGLLTDFRVDNALKLTSSVDLMIDGYSLVTHRRNSVNRTMRKRSLPMLHDCIVVSTRHLIAQFTTCWANLVGVIIKLIMVICVFGRC